jgi:NAD(P)-dependent dehydrogenase (short-subunit alcohol dehydrogenase family)
MKFAVVAGGTFLCYKYAAQQMIKQGRGGRIIGASSLCGKQCKDVIESVTRDLHPTKFALLGSTNISLYCRTKFAIRGITKAAGISVSSSGCMTILTPHCMELSSSVDMESP